MWTNTGTPIPLLRYRLMDKFGWTPQQLDAIPWRELQEIMAVMSVESAVERRRSTIEKMRRR
jgi:hypothetical protein